MKKYRNWILAGALIAFAVIAKAATSKYSDSLVPQQVVSYNADFTVDFQGMFEGVSYQAVYSTATVGNVSFNDGRPSTGSITVASLAALSTAPASVSITISSNNPNALNNSPDGSVLTLNGVRYVAGPAGKWQWGATPTLSAVALAAAITTDGVFNATSVGAVVYATTTLNGSYLNSWTVVTSSAGVLSIRGDTTAANVASTLTGGQDNAAIAINGVRVIANKDYFPITSVSAAATALAAAINTNLAGAINAQASGAVVTSTSASVGAVTAYSIYSSTQAALVIDGTVVSDGAGGATGAMRGGSNSAYAYNSGNITIANHALSSAYPVWLSTTAGFGITGLTGNVTYYAIPVDANTVRLATTSAFAVAGTPYVTLLSTSIAGPHTFGLNAQNYSGTPGLIWSASNDGTNFTDLSVSSVTYSATTPSSTLWSFDPADYRYYRVSVVKPTTGGINLKVTGHGRED
mgnify:CR=1 FL=1